MIEDSRILQDRIARALRHAGYAVAVASTGTDGLVEAQTGQYAIAILDLMLPGLDGMTVLSRLRRSGSTISVLILTARASTADRVSGLRAGADDYLVKPFDLDELLARVDALSRRVAVERTALLTIGRLFIDTAKKKARYGDRDLELRPREYALLEYLARRCDEPVPRSELENRLYGGSDAIRSNSIEAAVYAVRSKLERAGSPPMIQTRRGFGYVLAGPAIDSQ